MRKAVALESFLELRVRDGFLVGVRLTVVVPPQVMQNGQSVTSGVENQALVLLQINDTRTSTLKS